jgi:hypothetical protein
LDSKVVPAYIAWRYCSSRTRYENEEEYQKQNKILKNLEDIGTRYDNDELKQLQKEHLKDLEKLQHKYEKIKTSY